jgi:hypothetical protein
LIFFLFWSFSLLLKFLFVFNLIIQF